MATFKVEFTRAATLRARQYGRHIGYDVIPDFLEAQLKKSFNWDVPGTPVFYLPDVVVKEVDGPDKKKSRLVCHFSFNRPALRDLESQSEQGDRTVTDVIEEGLSKGLYGDLPYNERLSGEDVVKRITEIEPPVAPDNVKYNQNIIAFSEILSDPDHEKYMTVTAGMRELSPEQRSELLSITIPGTQETLGQRFVKFLPSAALPHFPWAQELLPLPKQRQSKPSADKP